MRSILKLVLAHFLMLSPANVIGATNAVDSILGYISTFDDTSKINVLQKSCWKFRNKKPQEAMILCQTALKLIEKQKNNNKKAATLNYLGVVYKKVENLDSAQFYFKKALSVAKQTNNPIEAAYAHNNLGDFYFRKALYALALENVLQAHHIFVQNNNREGLAYSLNKLGEIYINQQFNEKAFDTLQSAIKIWHTLNDEIRASICKQNIATIYVYKNELDKALEIYLELLEANKKNNYPIRTGIAFDGISDIKYEKQNYIEALKHRQEALKIYRTIGDKPLEINALNKLGLIFTALEEYPSARESLQSAKEMAISTNNKTQELLNYQFQINLAAAVEDYKMEVAYNRLYTNLKDSIFSVDSKSRLYYLEKSYLKEKEEIEVLLIQQKEKARKRVLALLLFSILSLIMLVAYMFNQHKKTIKIKKELEELNQSKDKFFSILAHDLKAPLTDLKGLTTILDDNYDVFNKKRIKEMIEVMRFSTNSVYNLLSRLLEWSRATTGRISYTPVTFPIYKEAESVLQLMKNMAKSKQLRLSLEIDPSHTVNADPNMVNTIIRNLVSNAIKFTPEKGSIELSSIKKGNRINIKVADDGIGIHKNEIDKVLRIDVRHTKRGTNNEKGTGVGLALCNELVKTNKGKLWVKSKPGKGTKFYFSLPLGD